jgi:hypothetical protein
MMIPSDRGIKSIPAAGATKKGGRAMANIIKFPDMVRKHAQARQQGLSSGARVAPKIEGNQLLAGVSTVVWVLVAVLWPVLQWVGGLDLLVQLIRMVYHWSTPGVHAGWTFLLHFAALSGLNYYVAFGQPKGF